MNTPPGPMALSCDRANSRKIVSTVVRWLISSLRRSVGALLVCCAGLTLNAATNAATANRCTEPSKSDVPVKVLIVTGGHPYEPSEFFALFNAIPGIRYQHVLLDKGKPVAVPVGGLGQYDVVLFYDLQHDAMTPDWRDLIDRGHVGLVFLHHAIGSFPLSPELKAIIGGQANFFFGEYPDLRHSSVAFAEQHFAIVDASHPVTCGMQDFDLVEEIYDEVNIDPGVHVLMTSSGPKHSPAVAWTWNYGKKRVLYVQPGHGSFGLPMDHGPTAYQNAAVKRLITRGILWAAGRL